MLADKRNAPPKPRRLRAILRNVRDGETGVVQKREKKLIFFW
jgi:hypothetical protein